MSLLVVGDPKWLLSRIGRRDFVYHDAVHQCEVTVDSERGVAIFSPSRITAELMQRSVPHLDVKHTRTIC